MDTFFSCGQFSNSNLISINHCHLAKQVLTVADICSGDGTCIQCNLILSQVAPFPIKLIWQCEQPSHKDWCIWSQALHLAFGPQLIIAIPLGGWLQQPHQPTAHIPYDSALDLFYQPGHHGVWLIFTKPPNALVTNSFMHYMYPRAATIVPPHGLPHHLCIPRPSPNALLSRF